MDNSIRNILKNAGKDPKEIKHQEEMDSLISCSKSVGYIVQVIFEEFKKDYEESINQEREGYYANLSISSTYPFKLDEHEFDINDLIREYNLSHSDSIVVYNKYYIFNTKALVDKLATYGVTTRVSLSSVSAAIPAQKFKELIDEANNTKRR